MASGEPFLKKRGAQATRWLVIPAQAGIQHKIASAVGGFLFPSPDRKRGDYKKLRDKALLRKAMGGSVCLKTGDGVL